MKVLFITPWYPSEKDAMAGLFVQKHADAVRAQGADVRVIHSQGWWSTWRQWRALRREGWLPDIVQLNIIHSQGLLALWLKRRYGIPYLIVEHWSGYLPENLFFTQMARPQRDWYKRIARHAEIILTVSDRHAQAMQACGITNPHWGRINNVVDDFFYEIPKTLINQNTPINPTSPKTFLHVSCFDEHAKNVKGLLRAAKRLSGKRQDWRLVLVGTGIDYADVRSYADSLHFPDGLLEWTGEITPREVAEWMSKADTFVLPSHYENAPVVISESLAKGLPVVASRVGGIPEMVNDQCGLLVTPGNDDELEAALERMLDHYQDYDREQIRQEGAQYAFATVGKKLKAIYEKILL